MTQQPLDSVVAQSNSIAIIGMAGLYPKAADVQAYWQNILNKVSGITEGPDNWTGPHYDPDSEENDRIYTKKAGFLGELARFNPLEFGIMPRSIASAEPDHFLAMRMARDVLIDAGYGDGQRPFNRQNTGIVIGRGTYINRGYSVLLQHGIIVDQTLTLLRQLQPELEEEDLQRLRKELKQSVAPFNAETVPSLVPNVITGRIANRLNLMGPNYLIDAACASSLIAVELAIQELTTGHCDLVLAGGLHTATPAQLYMMFCQLGALSRTTIRPFDAHSDGTLLGEGVGMVALKRLEEAESDGDRIYAVIKGVGSSSDGRGAGILAPRLEGQVLALERAYQSSQVDPSTIELIEAHGTGMDLGDRTEVKSLSEIFGQRQAGQIPNVALGSVKSMIGHCIPAAGMAGLIKTALALYHKVLPPMICEEVNPNLELEKTPFYINTEARPWIHGQTTPRRAGVNAFGFGGINAHAVLEEYRTTTDVLAVQETAPQMHAQWPTELVLLTGQSWSAVTELGSKVQKALAHNPDIQLNQLAMALAQESDGPCKIAILATSSSDLQSKLAIALEKQNDPQRHRLFGRQGILYSEIEEVKTPNKVAFLFPGEGSQYPNMLADLCLHFPQVRAWFDLLDAAFAGRTAAIPSSLIFVPPTSLTAEERERIHAQLFRMGVATETMFAASMGLYALLKECGITGDVMLGHSTGEFAALVASGTIPYESTDDLLAKMRHLNQIYRDFEAKAEIPKGVLMTVGGIKPQALTTVLEKFSGQLYLAMDNCPNQVVLFADQTAMESAMAELQNAGGICVALPFDRAYHTPLFIGITELLRVFFDSIEMRTSEIPLYSCCTAAAFPAEVEGIRELASRQWSSRVLFRETIEKLEREGVNTFIEVGPSSHLTGFIGDILKRKKGVLALASNHQRASGLEQFQRLLARLWVKGIAVNWQPLYQYRAIPAIELETLLSSQPQTLTMPLLDVDMPVLRARSQVIDEIRQAIKQPQPLPPAIATIPSLPSDNPPTSPSNLVVQPSVPRQGAIMNDYFGLMQDFLGHQTRVLTNFYDHSGTVDNGTNGQNQFQPLTPQEIWPFLGTVLAQSEGEIVWQRRLTMAGDIFLLDHTFGGKLSQFDDALFPLGVIPFTISMEILAEASQSLVGTDKVVISLFNLRGYRWLALDQGDITLEIKAKLLPQPSENQWDVYAQIFLPDAGMNSLVFEGTVRLAYEFPPAPPEMPFHLTHPQASWLPDEYLYRTGMFHGPRFQGVKHICRWGHEGIEAEMEVIPLDNFFRDIRRPRFQIDSGLMDAVGQLVGYWISMRYGAGFSVFPYQVKAFHQYGPQLADHQKVIGRGFMEFVNERQTISDFDFLDTSGAVVARIEQWQDRYFELPDRYYALRLNPQETFMSQPWRQDEGIWGRSLVIYPDSFLENSWGIWKRVLAHLVLNAQERDYWYNKLPAEDGKLKTEWLFASIVAKDLIRQWAEQTLNIKVAPVDVQVGITEAGEWWVSCPVLEATTPLPAISIHFEDNQAIAVLK